METPATNAGAAPAEPPKWRPLLSRQRRILGVLIEKAKTTPDGYPMTLNALVAGCNQKSNRDPQMELTAEDVEDGLEQLRQVGVVAEIQGGGRVPKYRHYAYEWLGVSGDELGVLCELLLRGSQSIGDLRARAARMAKIAGLEELRPLLQSLKAKNLIVYLTPEGRGQIVTHNLYPPDELMRQRQQFAGGATPAAEPPPRPAAVPAATAAALQTPSTGVPVEHVPAAQAAATPAGASEVEALRRDVQSLREEVVRLKKEIDDIWASLK